MNPKERKELAASKLLIIVFAVVGLAVVVWLAWLRPVHHVTSTADQTTSSQGAKSKSTDQVIPPKDEQQKYIVINEWNVRAPLGQDTYDMVYAYHPLEGDSVAFTFKRLQDVGICDPGVGVSMTRSMQHNQPPYNLDNPEPIAKVGEYSYYLAYAGEPCTTTATQAQKDVANTINNGDLNAAVRSVLMQLKSL